MNITTQLCCKVVTLTLLLVFTLRCLWGFAAITSVKHYAINWTAFSMKLICHWKRLELVRVSK